MSDFFEDFSDGIEDDAGGLAAIGGLAALLLGICFWREGRGNPGLAEYMGEKGGCF